MDWIKFLERLDQHRKRLGIDSDAALSRQAGLSQDAIRNWRRSADHDPESRPSLRSLSKMATFLGVSIQDLTGDLEQPLHEHSGFQETLSAFSNNRPVTPLGNDIQVRVVSGRLVINASVDRAGIEPLKSMIDAWAYQVD